MCPCDGAYNQVDFSLIPSPSRYLKIPPKAKAVACELYGQNDVVYGTAVKTED